MALVAVIVGTPHRCCLPRKFPAADTYPITWNTIMWSSYQLPTLYRKYKSIRIFFEITIKVKSGSSSPSVSDIARPQSLNWADEKWRSKQGPYIFKKVGWALQLGTQHVADDIGNLGAQRIKQRKNLCRRKTKSDNVHMFWMFPSDRRIRQPRRLLRVTKKCRLGRSDVTRVPLNWFPSFVSLCVCYRQD